MSVKTQRHVAAIRPTELTEIRGYYYLFKLLPIRIFQITNSVAWSCPVFSNRFGNSEKGLVNCFFVKYTDFVYC